MPVVNVKRKDGERMKVLGFIGLGIMGQGMATNIIKKSKQKLYGFDYKQEACEQFKLNGGIVVATPEEIYTHCDIIFLCLPTNEALESTVMSIADIAKPGTIIVDMGSTSPTIIKTLQEYVHEKGMHLMDAPVSGGEIGAREGMLVIMCGGENTTFEIIKPYLNMMGKIVTYIGESGCGSTAKLINNIMVGIHLLSISEAFAFAKKTGIDPNILFEAIKDGFAQSAVMDEKIPKVLNRDFIPGARIAVHMKDIKNALNVAESLGVDLPATKIVLEKMEFMEANNMIDEDQGALIKAYEKEMGVYVE